MRRRLTATIGWTSAIALAASLAQGGCDGRPLAHGEGAGAGGASGTGGLAVIGAGGSGAGGSVFGTGGSGVGGAGVGGRGAGGSGVGGKGAGGSGIGGAGVGGATVLCDSICVDREMCVGGICRGSASRWTTLGGDVHHSGYNVNETGGPPTTTAWQVSVGQAALWPAVSDGTTVYVSAQTSFNATTKLTALSPTNGQTLWTYDFGNIFGVGQPTVVDSRIYIAQCNNSMGTYMFSFAPNGAPLWSTTLFAQWEHYWAPLVAPTGRIYFDGGSYGGLYGLDTESGMQMFFNSSLEQYDSWSPLLLNGMLYTFIAGNLRTHDPTTGTISSTIMVPWNWMGWSMMTAPVSDGDKIYVIAPPTLYAFHPGQAMPAWSSSASFSGMPAVANGVVYAISGGQLRATDANSGMAMWTFAGDNQLSFPPVVTNSYVYVASTSTVFALKPSTQVSAWKAAPGGWLSIAGGKLYVAQPNGTLSAYTLAH